MSRLRAQRLRTASGARVDSVALTPKDAESALVFAHGTGAGMTHPFMADLAAGLAARHVASLRYQFPFMQAGSRRVDAAPVAHDTVRAAVARATALWPGLPLFAGGKSFGGRMTSQAQAIAPLPGVLGLVFAGFPLHPAGKPAFDRAAHLAGVLVPLLFLHGTRDALAEPALFAQVRSALGNQATVLQVVEADHAFHVPRRTGRTDGQVMEDLVDMIAVWTQGLAAHAGGLSLSRLWASA